ncbi:MAG: Hsp70 family protein [Gemmatimonadaceae bacterium]
MRVGIDLGTTFSCIAYVDARGQPRVIPSETGADTTPSVIAFDGRRACVGQSAVMMKSSAPTLVREFIKRDMGKPVEASDLDPLLAEASDGLPAETAPHEFGGFKYGAAGMSAIILRKLKRDALRFFVREGLVPADLKESDFELEAVITVPVYFHERERRETRLAGYAAGLKVIGIINEPTAAALMYGLLVPERQRVMVFDLGGGTFDVTVLQIEGENATVLTSDGANTLGGKDWDYVIDQYLRDLFARTTGTDYPENERMAFQMRSHAIAAKLALTDAESTTVNVEANGKRITPTLFRSAPADAMFEDAMFDDDPAPFYFEWAATDLVLRARQICEQMIRSVMLPTPGGGERPMTWRDIDEIVLTGGSSRMPMIPEMLRKLTGKSVRRATDGFSFDTAVALGAALYSNKHQRVHDVLSHSIGVEIERNGRRYVDPLILKDTPLPSSGTRQYTGRKGAVLRLFEGESSAPDECRDLGSVELDTDNSNVDVHFNADVDGVLSITAYYPPNRQKTLRLQHDLFDHGNRAQLLRDRVQSITVEP